MTDDLDQQLGVVHFYTDGGAASNEIEKRLEELNIKYRRVVVVQQASAFYSDSDSPTPPTITCNLGSFKCPAEIEIYFFEPINDLITNS